MLIYSEKIFKKLQKQDLNLPDLLKRRLIIQKVNKKILINQEFLVKLVMDHLSTYWKVFSDGPQKSSKYKRQKLR